MIPRRTFENIALLTRTRTQGAARYSYSGNVLAATDESSDDRYGSPERTLDRIASMVTHLIARSVVVGEERPIFKPELEYEYRDAEYEYKYEGEPNRFAFFKVTLI